MAMPPFYLYNYAVHENDRKTSLFSIGDLHNIIYTGQLSM